MVGFEAEGLVLNGNRGGEHRMKHPPFSLFTYALHSSSGVRPGEMPQGTKTTAAETEYLVVEKTPCLTTAHLNNEKRLKKRFPERSG